MAASTAFRDSYLGNDWDKEDYTIFEARQMRYKILWAMYESTAYRQLHKWSTKYKADYGLYQYIRTIYNPAYRLGEFWKNHLWGGRLDVVDGQATEKGALPIVTRNDKLRAPIAMLWKWSNWQVKKDTLALWTAVMGDAALRIVDDPAKKKVYLKLVHPGTLKSLELDDWGNVRGYELQEQRPDPRKPAFGGRRYNPLDRQITTKVTYTEVVTREGDNVVYQTYLNNSLYAWDEEYGETWKVPYTFVPLVVFRHNNIGLDYGMSELFPGLPKFREADDIASKLSDQIRKLVDSPWLMAGVKPTDLSAGTPEDTDENPQKGRQSIPMFFSGPEAKAQPLVAPLDIAATTAYILEILKGIEADYPELTVDKNNATGDISGRALRYNRAPAENKVQEIRSNYDDPLVRAQMMAIAIGGWRNYPGFEGFDLGSYGRGDLEHQIGDRPVFAKDPLDDLELETALWAAAKAAKEAGIALPLFLEEAGWPEEKIKKIVNSPEYKARLAALEASAQMARSSTEAVTTAGRPATNQQNADQQDENQPVDQNDQAQE